MVALSSRDRLPALCSYQGLSDVVKHGETIRLFVGELDRMEVKSFCYKEQADPEVGGLELRDEVA